MLTALFTMFTAFHIVVERFGTIETVFAQNSPVENRGILEQPN